MVSVPVGLLDDDPGVRPSMHVFTSSKVAWVDLNDDLRKYEKWVPGFLKTFRLVSRAEMQ